MKWKEPIYWVGIIGGALAVKFAADSFVLFMECMECAQHTFLECLIIGALY